MNERWQRRLLPLLRARHFDQVLLERADLLVDHYHVSIGLEGTATAIALHRQRTDPFLVNYRNHAHLVVAGADVTVLYAEIFERDLGPQRGRSGSFHLSDPDLGFPHTSALVAGSVPLACGVAWARKRRGERDVVFTNFGEGALGEGVVHECLNIAKLWDLPIVFVCESNESPLDGRANASQSAAHLLDIPRAHQVSTTFVDATQPAECDDALATVIADVRAGGGPHFVQAQSWPWHGNATFFPANPDGILDVTLATAPVQPGTWSAGDPVLNEVRLLLKQGVDLRDIAALSESVRAEMLAALSAALKAPLAPAHAALEDVWSPAVTLDDVEVTR